MRNGLQPITNMDKALIQKYNVAGPRYTSYPTVPYWSNSPTIDSWKAHVKNAFDVSNNEEGISLYLHLPYCESLCTFCGCNTRITVNHAVETPYIETLLAEWKMYLTLLENTPQIREIHLGGGTPTFFQPENLTVLINGILAGCTVHSQAEFSFEAHPKNTSKPHLEALYKLGFRRLSLGIQDFDPVVQEIVNRVQPFEMVEEVVTNARALGYHSINFDLIYGLPMQTQDSVRNTVELTLKLMPERIAFYSYAHVPWLKPGQRSYTDKDLPSDSEKRALYELGKELFEQAGYEEIGMDHFALPADTLYRAMKNKKLHRNFMGYTHNYTRLMIGLGVSSISDSWTCFAQNLKVVEAYSKSVKKGEFPIFRGHELNEEDLVLRQHILNLMCHFETSWDDESQQCDSLYAGLARMDELEADGFIVREPYRLTVTEKGQPFVRNICMPLDARLWRKAPATELFSKTV